MVCTSIGGIKFLKPIIRITNESLIELQVFRFSKDKNFLHVITIYIFVFGFSNCTAIGDYCTTLDPYTIHYEDSTNLMSVEDANLQLKNNKVEFISNHKPSYGYSNSNHWFSFRSPIIPEDTTYFGVRRSYLVLDNPLLDEIHVFYKLKNWTIHLKGGDQIPFTKRDLPLITQTFRIPIDVSYSDIVVQIKSKGNLRIGFHRCYSEGLVSFESSRNLQYGLFFGSLLFISIYHLITFILSKRLIFLLFSLYSIFLTAFFLTTSGFSQKYIYPELEFFNNHIVQYTNLVSITFGFLFILSYFPFLTKKPYRYLFVVPVLTFLSLHLILIPILPYPYLSQIIPMFGVIITLSLSIILCYQPKLRSSEKWIRFGLFILSIAILISLLRSFNIIPINLFTIHILKISQLVEVLLFAVAAGSQYNELKAESDRSKIEKEIAIKLAQSKTDTMNYLSHEVRSPLHSIMAYIEILSDKASDLKTKTELKYLTQSANHLLKIVSDVLDQSKLEAGKIKIERNRFKIHDFIDEVYGAIKPIADQQNLKFELHLDQNLPKEIYADSIHLHQILTNLLFNAVKFTKEGSIQLHVKRESETIRFLVKDTGVGMGLEDQNLLYREFQQNAKTFYRKYGGSGLGLMICKGLLELMGSALSLKSEKNIGTEFSFSIPIE